MLLLSSTSTVAQQHKHCEEQAGGLPKSLCCSSEPTVYSSRLVVRLLLRLLPRNTCNPCKAYGMDRSVCLSFEPDSQFKCSVIVLAAAWSPSCSDVAVHHMAAGGAGGRQGHARLSLLPSVGAGLQ